MLGKVLIIDDIATNRIVFKVKLNAAGYAVIQAENGAEGCAVARAERPDLVLMPAQLPDTTAPELIARLQAQPGAKSLPVIVLLEPRDLEKRLALLEAGAADVLMQPPDSGALLARFRALLRAKESEEEATLKEHMRRSLGFQEAASHFETPWNVQFVTENAQAAQRWIKELRNIGSCRFCVRNPADILHETQPPHAPPDVIVIALGARPAHARLDILSDLKASRHLRHSKLITLLPQPDAQLFAHALDRGADEVLQNGFCAAEMGLRIAQLARRKRKSDRARAAVQEGLSAAITDPLTNLFNRRFALPHLASALVECRRTNAACAALAIDIDHFKTVNDRYGHQTGDGVLRELALLLRRELRSSDMIARMGGEEFLVVMQNTSQREVEAVAQRLCRVIAQHRFSQAGVCSNLRLTVSIGIAIAQANAHRLSTDEILAQADSALYGSKRHGRNKVTLSSRSAA